MRNIGMAMEDNRITAQEVIMAAQDIMVRDMTTSITKEMEIQAIIREASEVSEVGITRVDLIMEVDTTKVALMKDIMEDPAPAMGVASAMGVDTTTEEARMVEARTVEALIMDQDRTVDLTVGLMLMLQLRLLRDRTEVHTIDYR